MKSTLNNMNREEKVKFGEAQEEKIVNAIIGYIQKHGYAPSIRELCAITEIKSTSSVQGHLKRMFEKGIIETDAAIGSPRAIRVPGYKFVKEEE